MLYQRALYHCHTPMGELEEVLWFIVPTAHQVTAMNGCHREAGHQGQQQTLCLLHDWFWWPEMVMQMQKAISSCEQCIQHEGSCTKAPVQPIIATAPLGLLHIDFTSIETTMELDQPPDVVNFLVFCDHFTKHITAYMTPDQTVKTVTKFLWQGGISQSSEHQSSSWETEETMLKATSSVSLWPYGRLGVHFTMLKPMDRCNELTKCWCAW